MGRLTVAGLVLAISSTVSYSQDWPRRTITLIVPNAVGGAYDAAARPLGTMLSQVLGQPVVIDNRPAGGGIAGLVGTQQATPDGHTLLFTGQGQVSLYPELRPNLPYEPTRDLAPIIRIGSLESFLMANPSLPVKSMKDLIDLVRAKPDTITFGTWGGTSTSNMHVEFLKKARNIQFFAVPYKSAAQALNAGVSGEVQITLFGQGPSIPLIKSGKFKALGTTGTRRSSALPDVPLLKETGVGWDLETGSWVGMFAPAKTPRAIINRVNAEVGKLLSDRAYTDKFLLSIGFQPEEPNTPEQFTEFLKHDRQTYASLIKLTGIKDE